MWTFFALKATREETSSARRACAYLRCIQALVVYRCGVCHRNTLKFVFATSLLMLAFIFGPFSTAEVSLMKARSLLTADADFSPGLRSLWETWCKDFYYIVLKRVENSSEWQKENNFGIYFEPFCAWKCGWKTSSCSKVWAVRSSELVEFAENAIYSAVRHARMRNKHQSDRVFFFFWQFTSWL